MIPARKQIGRCSLIAILFLLTTVSAILAELSPEEEVPIPFLENQEMSLPFTDMISLTPRFQNEKIGAAFDPQIEPTIASGRIDLKTAVKSGVKVSGNRVPVQIVASMIDVETARTALDSMGGKMTGVSISQERTEGWLPISAMETFVENPPVLFIDKPGEAVLSDVQDIAYVEPQAYCGALEPCYSKIQDAIDGASDSGIIKVAAGIYSENIDLNEFATGLSLEFAWDDKFSTLSQMEPVIIDVPPQSPTAADAATEVATSIASRSATLNGTVNPKNATTTVVFKYGINDFFLDNEIIAIPDTLTGTTDQVVFADLSGLTSDTTYRFRVMASNSSSCTFGGILKFTTLPVIGDRRYCDVFGPCSEGQGHCNDDDECLEDLVCVKDIGAQYGFAANVDICDLRDTSYVEPEGYCGGNLQPCYDNIQDAIDAASESCKIRIATGEYFENIVLDKNLLRLEFAWDDEFVAFSQEEAVVISGPLPLLGEEGYCRKLGSCSEGEGGCDFDTECQDGLVCEEGVGADYGWASDIGVCEKSTPEPVPGDKDYCEKMGPCPEGKGNCGGDDECEIGLDCVVGAGNSYGFSKFVDVCIFLRPVGSDCQNPYQCAEGFSCVNSVCHEGRED